MITKGLLIRLIVKHGKDEKAEAFLFSALPLVKQKTGTIAWFTIYFGSLEYGILMFFQMEQLGMYILMVKGQKLSCNRQMNCLRLHQTYRK
jgi:hypothetical protein